MNNSAANTNGRSYAGNFGRSGSNGRQTGWSNRTFQGADTYNNGGRSFSGSIGLYQIALSMAIMARDPIKDNL